MYRRLESTEKVECGSTFSADENASYIAFILFYARKANGNPPLLQRLLHLTVPSLACAFLTHSPCYSNAWHTAPVPSLACPMLLMLLQRLPHFRPFLSCGSPTHSPYYSAHDAPQMFFLSRSRFSTCSHLSLASVRLSDSRPTLRRTCYTSRVHLFLSYAPF